MSANTLLKFRELETLEDWEVAIKIRNTKEIYSPITVTQAKSWREMQPEGTFSKRLLMFDGDRAVAYGTVHEAYWQEVEKIYNVQVSCLTEPGYMERHAEFFEKLSEIAVAEGAKRISSHWRSDKPEFGDWFEGQGFSVTLKCPGSKLELDEFDPSRFSGAIERVQKQGIELITLNQFKDRYPDTWQHQYWRLDSDLMSDVPLPEPWKDTPFEAFLKQLADPALDYNSLWVAMDGDVVTGGTQIHPNLVDSKLATTGLTGMRRDYRRRGIATALKANSLACAKSKGIKTVTTDNEENNPMYQLNLDLGFKYFTDYILVQKML
ncbi:MAG: GNAT family N-acetyltransferase [Fimbriimonadaceae bacterium]|nr:GNAT family N-acetyltransferase [Fimbriimonadaceae bacterium]